MKGKMLDVLKMVEPGNNADVEKKGLYFNWYRLSWKEPARTVMTWAIVVHPELNRFLTIPEVKRISSFPDQFEFVGSFQKQWARIGNSVPPLFMRGIANHVKKTVLGII